LATIIYLWYYINAPLDFESKIIMKKANLLKNKDAKPWVYIHFVYDCQVAIATWQFFIASKYY